MKTNHIFKAVFILLVTSLAVFSSSCEKSLNDVMEVSGKKSVMPGDYGQMFITVRCSGDWTLSLTGDEGTIDWASLNVTQGTGDKNNIILTHHRNIEETSRVLYLVLDNGRKSVSCKLTQLSSLASGDDQTQDGGSGGETPVPGVPSVPNPVNAKWLELPAMNDSGLDYYSHSFTMGGKTYRNYTFGWSKKDYVAKWVAYPLNKVYTNGDHGGSGDWAPNPQVEYKYQPNFGNSFGFSKGYERGHQIANADRKCCAQANIQTYYYTNSTLQHTDFNGKIWAKLEGNMRSVPESAADTCYVVTGCVLSADPEHITDPDGKLVPIPEAYFKAALCYSPSSTFGTWLSAGFYLKHQKYPDEYISEAEVMSVDMLEAKLGMDFFVNLPGKIGQVQADAVEAQNPLSYKSLWNIR